MTQPRTASLTGIVTSFYVESDNETVVLTVDDGYIEGSTILARITKSDLAAMIKARPRYDAGLPQTSTPSPQETAPEPFTRDGEPAAITDR